jgi:hypothetical protein
VHDHSSLQKRPVSGARALHEAPFRRPGELDVDGGDENDSGPLADLRLMRLSGVADDLLRGQIAMGLARSLYRAARIANNAETLASGNPKRIRRRAKNILVGRALGCAGIWRRLWR